ncbi:MAG TPA: MFS transporter [Pseudorhodoplanes sp.]|nr:MFS transporter [Pseudorhodoplanes sp.]
MQLPASHKRILPLIVATAFFMENMDSTVIATSLPAIAADIGTNPLALKLAVTSYLLSLAVFIPASGWTADRFGARTVFASALVLFMLGSIGCAFARSLEGFVFARILQGIGGAMMTPVGRLVIVRTVDKRELVNAMAWVTTPALVGPIVGPPLGGFITTYASWPWIFLINIPIGLLGLALALRYIDPVRAGHLDRFDALGMALSGLGVAGLAFGLSVAGLDLLPWWIAAALVTAGALFMSAYILHARRVSAPALDFSLLSLPTMRAGVAGGFMFRLGIGSLAFLLPLLLQLGFGYSPFHSGLITFATAVGAFGMKTVAARVIERFGFRTVLIGDAVVSAAFLAACATFKQTTPVSLMVAVLLVGGFFRSLQFTCINTVAYADVDARRMSRATSMMSVAQQLAISAGVAVGALIVETTLRIKGTTQIAADDFAPAFVIVALISAASALVFAQLPADAGAEMSGHRPVPAPKAEPIAAAETTDRRIG